MKRIGFNTTNRMFAQSFAAIVKNNPGLGFEPYLLLNPRQATLDAEVLKIDVAVVDVIDGAPKEAGMVLSFCEKVRQRIPVCRLLLLVSQEDKAGRELAIKAIKSKIADDYVFYDASLDYLFAKLAAI